MSKSLDYCVKRASDKSLSSLSDRNWNNAVEWHKTEEIFDNIFEYNANHSFLLKSGGCIITKKIGDIGTITTVNSNGELKKVKKL